MRGKGKYPEKGSRKPLISIVIPTKNSGATLERCLESIAKQSFTDYEIIIIDAKSDDETVHTARKYADLVLISTKPLSASRNLGFRHAKGSIFLSIDSDMVLEPGLLEDVVRTVGSADAAVIPELGAGTSFISRCKALEKSIYLNDPAVESARAFSRPAFLSLGGYNPALLLAEDRDLHCRFMKRFRIGRTRIGLLHNTDNLGVFGDLKKSFGYGRSLGIFMEKNPPAASGWMKSRGNFFFSCLSRFPEDPVHLSALLALRALEYTAGTLGYIAGYIDRIRRPRA